jgi:tetratricopeptide (TPR) repeat protein
MEAGLFSPRTFLEALKPALENEGAAAPWTASADRQLLQDYRPLTASLEWELSGLYWEREGVRAFARDGVPFIVNNDSRTSESAAAILFANCLEAKELEDRIAVLELGAGTGLFSRYFLDAFQAVCAEEGRDFYERLICFVSDRSRRTVEHWTELELFRDHAAHVVLGTCDALRPAEFRDLQDRPVPIGAPRAVFANYSLDVLPSAVIRAAPQGPEQLCVRTYLANGRGEQPWQARLNSQQAAELIATDGAADRSRLIPLLPYLEFEADFLPIGDAALPYLDEALAFGDGLGRSTLNYGAITCLEECLRILRLEGFVLINDYGPVERSEVANSAAHQRFGSAAAMGVNFPFLEHHFSKSGRLFLRPSDDGKRRIHARLLCPGDQARTAAVFHDHFSAAAWQYLRGPEVKAAYGAATGRKAEALANYQTALARNPRNWFLIGQAAEFVTQEFQDFAWGFRLARAALELNPWYSPWLWNILGECLFGLERFLEAHAAYRHAHAVDPNDIRTNLNLASSHCQLGEFGEGLEAIARGLARDLDGRWHGRLLAKQHELLAAVLNRGVAKQERIRKQALVFAHQSDDA